MGDRLAKTALYDRLADAAKALGSGRRVELVDVLAQGERSVEELAGEIVQSVANTSQHLQVLARAGLVDSRREGNRILYRLAGEQVEDLWTAMRAVATRHVDGVERLAAAYLGDRDGLEQLTRAELTSRLHLDEVEVWDIRPQAEFVAGHVPGAISVPPDQVERRIGQSSSAAEVVAYCRGPFCVYADDAVRELRRMGRRASRLEDGFPEWRRAGLPVEVGA
ncbi:MAG TPA: metalloregulator ArsR/SmtB family transcription factor [Acidimicrobiales bacterium]|nr:metalloregulator ArsR/SmtB family transcription factor [Acidimicrobiales bacterium]